MASIKVLAGDIKTGSRVFTSTFGRPQMTHGTQSYSLKGPRVELMNEEKVKKLAGTAGWGVAGAALLGPLGAIGGMLLGGNKREVVFACYFGNGKKFIASTDGKTWEKILAAQFSNVST